MALISETRHYAADDGGMPWDGGSDVERAERELRQAVRAAKASGSAAEVERAAAAFARYAESVDVDSDIAVVQSDQSDIDEDAALRAYVARYGSDAERRQFAAEARPDVWLGEELEAAYAEFVARYGPRSGAS